MDCWLLRSKGCLPSLFKDYHGSKSKYSPTKNWLKLEESRMLIVKNYQKSHANK